MKKKSPKNVDVSAVMVQIQAQLAALDKKLDAFINKSLTDIAGALAAQKTAIAPRPAPQPAAGPIRPQEQNQPPRRQMYAVVCYECGKDAELPFKPAPGRPVYCPECFAKRKAQANQPKPPVAIQAPTSPIKEVKEKKKTPSAKKSAPKKKPSAKRKK